MADTFRGKPRTDFFKHEFPKDGYPKIEIFSKNGRRGPSGAVIWGLVIVSTIYGLSKVVETNTKNRWRLKERRDCRIAIYPFLQVELDRENAAARKIELEREARIMKDVPGWVVGKSVYSK